MDLQHLWPPHTHPNHGDRQEHATDFAHASSQSSFPYCMESKIIFIGIIFKVPA